MKSKLRKEYLKRRSECKNPLSDLIIYNKVIRGIKEFDQVLIYVSKESEVDTIEIIEYCIHNNVKVAVPKCDKEHMNFYYINSLDELKLGLFNVLEPDNDNLVKEFNNSICIIPGILFDYEGNRIGYGKGYYDKFLKDYDGVKLGITYKECLIQNVPHKDYDIEVDFIITD